MISYVLVLFESLTTGQLTQAYLEGPMSDSWCQQLIERDAYGGEDESSRRLPFCVSGPGARQMLWDYRCRPKRERTVPWRHHFECDMPIATAARAIVGPLAASPAPPPPAPQPPAPQPASIAPPAAPALRPPQKQFHLGTATAALVEQAHAQVGRGHDDLAAATVERAVRIEPENPLVWVELGQLRLRQGDAAQADAIERKALALSAGNSEVQASAWRTIAESLRVRGRNQEAADADRTALTFSPH